MRTSCLACAALAVAVPVLAFGKASTFYVSTNDIHSVDGSDLGWGTYVTDDGVAHDAYTNLQQVIQYCNDKGFGGSTIWIEDGFVVSEGSSGGYRIKCVGWNEQLTLRSRSGDWRTGAEIRGDATTRCVSGTGSDTFIGLRIVGGTATDGNGGGINVTGPYGINLVNCLIADCTASGNGGGYHSQANGITVINCVFTNNVCIGGSGACLSGVHNVYDCTFIDNHASGAGWSSGNGGGIAGAKVVSNCTFTACTASNPSQINHASHQAGGGGALDNCTLVMDCAFTNCTASAGGGALARCGSGFGLSIYKCQSGRGGGGISGGSWKDCSVISCSDTNQPGGANWCAGGVESLTLGERLVISNCFSKSYGGGAYNSTLVDSLIIGNIVSNSAIATSGGGLHTCKATNCWIVSNRAMGSLAQRGDATHGGAGGAYNSTLVGCLVSNNVAFARGGGVAGGTARNCMIVDNYAYAQGGGASESTAFYNTLIARNTAQAQGGIFAYSVACVQLINSTVTANTNLALTAQLIVSNVAMTNSVVYGNKINSSSTEVSGLKASANSCWPTATEGIDGNTAKDPRLCTFEGKEYAATAPWCKGEGVEFAWMTDPLDIRSRDWYGNARIRGPRPDMGWVSLRETGTVLLVR